VFGELTEFFSDLFDPIVQILRVVLEFFYNLTDAAGFGSYGAAIILLTIVVKMALYPLTVKQLESTRAMQILQPKMKEIQAHYKNNPQLMQQKVAELYRDAGVNPLAGCLPMLIQMPILMGMYYALYNFDYPTAEAARFLWVESLSQPDPLYVLPVLSALSTFLVQKLSAAEMNPQMKMMMMLMPLFIGYISLEFPAGLVLYWVAMNVVQMGQQWWLFRNHEDLVKRPAASSNDKKGKKAKGDA